MEENNSNPNMEQNVSNVANAPTNQTQEVPTSETTISTQETQNMNSSSGQTENKKLNICCLLSFIFAMVGIIVYGFFCGIIATILGIIGVATFKPQSQKAKGLGIAGLAVGAVEFVVMGLIVFSSVASLL